jgi:hypothetical protein
MRSPLRPALGAFACLSLLVVAGCGTERRATPPEVAAVPEGTKTLTALDGDVVLRYPENWAKLEVTPPAAAEIGSGGAALTVWAYRAAAVVENRPQARAALDALVESLGRRARSVRVDDSRVTEVAGSEAVELLGESVISGRRVGFRSVHVYKGAGEYVIDAYSTPEQFDRVNNEVFGPVIGSISLGGNPPAAEG